MCGLIGFSGKENFNTEKIGMLLLYNDIRGGHSTGIWTNEKDNIVVNTGTAAEDFLPDFKINPATMFIGHTRFATMGARSKENAHPFRYGNVIGAHNGTINNCRLICTKYDVNYIDDVDVDSQSLFMLLDKLQNEEILEKYKGAAAILFTRSDGSLYAYRDSERPLFRGETDEGIYLSSIESSLKTIGCIRIKSLAENFLYKIVDGKIIDTKKINRKNILEEEKIQKDNNSYNGYPNNSYNGYPNTNTHNTGYSNTDTIKHHQNCLCQPCITKRMEEGPSRIIERPGFFGVKNSIEPSKLLGMNGRPINENENDIETPFLDDYIEDKKVKKDPTVLRAEDFKEIEAQYWSILENVREGLKDIKEGIPYLNEFNLEDDKKELLMKVEESIDLVEEDIFEMFKLNE